jgi:hypothetical protein
MTPASAEPARQLPVPTYQNRLRVMGQQLDLGGYRSINLLELPGGFLIRALRTGERVPEALEYPLGEFPELLAQAVAAHGEGERRHHPHHPHPLLTTGYEDFLRALGRHLDEQRVEAITVAELEGFVAVGGLTGVEGYERTGIAPFQLLLRAEDIGALLDGAFHRRAPAAKPEAKRWGPFTRGSGQ